MTDITLPMVSKTRRVTFYILVGLWLLIQIYASGFAFPYLPSVLVGWFQPEFSEYMIGGAGNCVLLAALISQLYKPESNVAGVQMLIIMITTSTIGSLIDGSYGWFLLMFWAIFGGIILLHPRRQDILRFGRPSNLELLALVGLAAVPVFIYVFNLWNLSFTTGDLSYSSHANIATDMFLYGLLASFKTSGWRVPAWSAGFLAIVYGLTSLVYPELISSVSMLWGILATVWGLVFIGVAEWKRRQECEA